MSQCKYCSHFKFERTMYLYTNSPPITQGRCTYDGRDYGNMTLSITTACKNFFRNKHCFRKGDVLKGDKDVVFVEDICDDYYPRCYRVYNNKNSTWSASAEELFDGYVLIMRGAKDDGGKEYDRE